MNSIAVNKWNLFHKNLSNLLKIYKDSKDTMKNVEYGFLVYLYEIIPYYISENNFESKLFSEISCINETLQSFSEMYQKSCIQIICNNKSISVCKK